LNFWSALVVALNEGDLLLDVLGIVVAALLMLLNCFFENVEFVLIAAPFGLPPEPAPKEPQHSDGDDYVSERGHHANSSAPAGVNFT